MFILASSSQYRRQLFSRLGLPFKWQSPDIDETPLPDEAADMHVKRLALEKARAISANNPDKWCIGSDQVCLLDGVITGKPHTIETAISQLQQASGKSITFLTGLALIHQRQEIAVSGVEPFTVHFRQLTNRQIKAYINKEKPLDCAGSFKSEGLGICLFERMEGRDPNGLIGLPLILLLDMLLEQGIDPLLYSP